LWLGLGYYYLRVDHVPCIDILVQNGCEIDAPDEHGKTPLHYAAEFGKADAIDVFIDEGANLDAADDDGKTPLHLVRSPTFSLSQITLQVQIHLQMISRFRAVGWVGLDWIGLDWVSSVVFRDI
jgi:hypothetical protein